MWPCHFHIKEKIGMDCGAFIFFLVSSNRIILLRKLLMVSSLELEQNTQLYIPLNYFTRIFHLPTAHTISKKEKNKQFYAYV